MKDRRRLIVRNVDNANAFERLGHHTIRHYVERKSTARSAIYWGWCRRNMFCSSTLYYATRFSGIYARPTSECERPQTYEIHKRN